MTVPLSGDHGAMMDGVYRWQRHIYDLTRKYYLFGRDRLIKGLNIAPGDAVLELACGTGRNLVETDRRWQGAKLFGLDISHEMLKTADQNLGGKAKLTCGDATMFDAAELFGRDSFDRVILSYSLSMIPDWRRTIEQAVSVLAPFGSVHIVDFGDLGGLPAPLRAVLRVWLSQFHVTPRPELAEYIASFAARKRMRCRTRRGPFGYYQIITLSRRD